MTKIGKLLMVLLLLSAGSASAADWKVPFPSVPKGDGEACVRDTAFMRTNHMELLLHQRDETVHQGVRPKQTALTECLTCHAVKDKAAKPVTYKDPKHFNLFSKEAKEIELFDKYHKMLGALRKSEKIADRAMSIASLLLYAKNGGEIHQV